MNSVRHKAVILNDTRGDAHFGCMRVMRGIESSLASRNIEVVATSLVRNDWERDQPFLDALGKSDLIVINGEGTLHHGARYGERLLRIARHPARNGKLLALVNAMYQDNPESWGEYLRGFDFLAARDADSRRALEKASGQDVMLCPDFSLGEGRIDFVDGNARELLTFSGSVVAESNAMLRRLASSRSGALFVTIQDRLKLTNPNRPFLMRMLRKGYAWGYEKLAVARDKRLIIPRDEEAFIELLTRSHLHVTGRFHAVCLCLATGTPFIAIKSNSRKIESLLDLFGLGRDRLVDEKRLEAALSEPRFMTYTEEEQAKITKGLSWSAQSKERLFDGLSAALDRGFHAN